MCLTCKVVDILECVYVYRHERPTDPDDPLADQNIKDRYYGVNDPVADKLLKRAAAMPALPPPEDQTITTLYIGNLGTLSESELRYDISYYHLHYLYINIYLIITCIEAYIASSIIL